MCIYSPGMANAMHTEKDLSNQTSMNYNSDIPKIYQIRIKGCLDSQWSQWFEDLRITPEENATTLLSGPVADEAALHGLLKKIRDLGMPLLSVNIVDTDHFDQPDKMERCRGK
jgi:hypothetical protein